jgi:hypothetical protein
VRSFLVILVLAHRSAPAYMVDAPPLALSLVKGAKWWLVTKNTAPSQPRLRQSRLREEKSY